MTISTLPNTLAGTERMQVDPEALHDGEAASESSGQTFPISSANCAAYPEDLDWVPDRERPVVPDLMAALCRACPGRQECLLWALTGQEFGYWGGTTSADRAQMRARGVVDVAAADQLQARARRAAACGALHGPGEGSYFWYRRRGCRCVECRQANAEARCFERAKARDRAMCAA